MENEKKKLKLSHMIKKCITDIKSKEAQEFLTNIFNKKTYFSPEKLEKIEIKEIYWVYFLSAEDNKTWEFYDKYLTFEEASKAAKSCSPYVRFLMEQSKFKVDFDVTLLDELPKRFNIRILPKPKDYINVIKTELKKM